MQADPKERNLKAVESWAGLLACPVCLGEVRLDTGRATCAGCGRAYPVADGIAVLIAERAVESLAAKK